MLSLLLIFFLRLPLLLNGMTILKVALETMMKMARMPNLLNQMSPMLPKPLQREIAAPLSNLDKLKKSQIALRIRILLHSVYMLYPGLSKVSSTNVCFLNSV